MCSDFSLNSIQYANDRVVIRSLSTAFSASHRQSSVHGDGWYNSERLMRVRGSILAKVWRASRAGFNSRARSLYGIGAFSGWQPITNRYFFKQRSSPYSINRRQSPPNCPRRSTRSVLMHHRQNTVRTEIPSARVKVSAIQQYFAYEPT